MNAISTNPPAWFRIVAVLAYPAIPNASQQVWERIGMPGQVADQPLPVAAVWGQYPGGPVVKGEALFPRLRMPEASEAG